MKLVIPNPEAVEQQEHSYLAGRNISGSDCFGKQFGVTWKVKNMQALKPSNSTVRELHRHERTRKNIRSNQFS